MKKILVVISIIALLLLGCSKGKVQSEQTAEDAQQQETADEAQTEKESSEGPSGYAGFMPWKAGMWSQLKLEGDTWMRQEIIETTPNYKFQTTTNTGDQESVVQVWLDKSYKPVKYVVKSQGQVMCMDIGAMPEQAVPDRGEEYPADAPDMRSGVYTTPTGKKVAVAIYSTGDGESWVSSEVPFGMVKSVTDGKTVMALQDYGTGGVKNKISAAEVSNCMDVSKLATPDDVTVKTGGEAGATMDCEVCSQMPVAARSACLASCS